MPDFFYTKNVEIHFEEGEAKVFCVSTTVGDVPKYLLGNCDFRDYVNIVEGYVNANFSGSWLAYDQGNFYVDACEKDMCLRVLEDNKLDINTITKMVMFLNGETVYS